MKFHKHRLHKDYRRSGTYDIIPGLSGDVNFTIHKPHIIPKELHMHKRQFDYFAIVKGKVLFRLIDKTGKEEKVILDEQDHKTLIIPPYTWHGYLALKPTIMVFYINHKYNPADEFCRKTEVKEWEI